MCLGVAACPFSGLRSFLQLVTSCYFFSSSKQVLYSGTSRSRGCRAKVVRLSYICLPLSLSLSLSMVVVSCIASMFRFVVNMVMGCSDSPYLKWILDQSGHVI